MSAPDVLEDIRGYARAGRILFVAHAWTRMQQRRATAADVRCALENAEEVEPDADRWRVTGPDVDGDDLTVVVVIEDGVVVITVF